MSFLNSRINPELPLTNSIEETELRTTVGKNKQTALNHDMGKETAMKDSKLRFWTTEDKVTLPLVRSRNHRGDRVILLVLCLMCAAALGLSLLMLFCVLRPHIPPETKIGKNESPRCLCNFFPLI